MRRRSLAVRTASALLPVLCAIPPCRSQPKAPDPAALVLKLRGPDATASGEASLELIRLGEEGK